jgi:hypothetical protein
MQSFGKGKNERIFRFSERSTAIEHHLFRYPGIYLENTKDTEGRLKIALFREGREE